MPKQLVAHLTAIATSFQQAFFAEAGEYRVRLFRSAVGLALFLTTLSWLGSFRWFFGPDGYVPVSMAPSLGKYSESWLAIFNTDPFTSLPVVILGYVLLILAALALMTNRYVKVAAPIAFVLFLSFMVRNPAMSYGGTDVLQLLLFGVVLLSLPGKKATETWPLLLVQFQFALIYFTAGLSKAQTADWYNGTKMFATFSDPTFSYIDPTFLIGFPLVLSLITWFGFMSELAFAFLIWAKGTRLVALGIVAMLHVGILLSMNVHLFSEIMLLGLTGLLLDSEAKWLTERLSAAKARVVSAVRGSKRKVHRVNS